MPPIRNEQKPVKRAQIKTESAHVTDPEAFTAALAHRRSHEETWSDPSHACKPDFLESRCQRETGQKGEREAALDKRQSPLKFHPTELALKMLKGKGSPSCGKACVWAFSGSQDWEASQITININSPKR